MDSIQRISIINFILSGIEIRFSLFKKIFVANQRVTITIGDDIASF